MYMRRFLAFLSIFCGIAHAAAPACPQTSGTLTVSCTPTRTSAISPYPVWFDCTATTDSSLTANQDTFRDIWYLWNFQDAGPSGQGLWGAGPCNAYCSKNLDTGAIGAHFYQIVDGSGDTTYHNITVTATNPVTATSVTCSVTDVTVLDAAGVNGWPNAATTCISSSGTPVAGSGGCPAGAAVLNSSAVQGGNLTNKRQLYKCGDAFTTATVTLSGTKGAMDRYGSSCTGSNNPILRATAGNDGILNLNNPSTDIRVGNFTLDGNSILNSMMIDNQNGGSINSGNKPTQYVFYNLNCINASSCYRWNVGGQMALVNSINGPILTGNQQAAVFTNWAGVGNGNNFSGTGSCAACLWSVQGPSEDYKFIAGNKFQNEPGSNTTSFETWRDSYGSRDVIAHNEFSNAGPSYAPVKYHNLNFSTDGGTGAWSGLFNQYNRFSDNKVYGSSGAQCVEIAPQNSESDERQRSIVVERNSFNCSEGFGRQVSISANGLTIRDNVFITASGSAGVQVCHLGIEPAPTLVEVYNNTFSGGGSSPAIAFSNGLGCSGQSVAVSSSVAQNNLIFNAAVPQDNGVGNTVNHNTATTSNNPGFKNYSGSFSTQADFIPTANFSGALNGVPVLTDVLGRNWSPTWDLGAVHH